MANSQGFIASTAAPQATATGVKLNEASPVLQAFSWARENWGNKKTAAAKKIKIKLIFVQEKAFFGIVNLR